MPGYIQRDGSFTGHGAADRCKLSLRRTVSPLTDTFAEAIQHMSAHRVQNTSQLCTAAVRSHRPVFTTTATRHVCFTAARLGCAESVLVQHMKPYRLGFLLIHRCQCRAALCFAAPRVPAPKLNRRGLLLAGNALLLAATCPCCMQIANASEGGGAFGYAGEAGPQAWPGEMCTATSLPSVALQSCPAEYSSSHDVTQLSFILFWADVGASHRVKCQ